MLKTIFKTSVSIIINAFNNNFCLNSNKIAGLGNINLGEKVKNLSKTKNFKKLANAQKHVKTKANLAVKTSFYIYKAKVVFI